MRFVLAILNLVNSNITQNIVARDAQLVRIFIICAYSVGFVLLVRVEGNTRAEDSGTATMQSRFFYARMRILLLFNLKS